MTPGDGDRLAALLAGDDLDSARAALARAAGPELSRLAYLILQHRSAAEAAGAAALAASINRAATSPWRPTGDELRAQLVGDTIAAALRRYDGTREVDPLADARPATLPADPVARAVVAAVLVAGLPLPAAARAAGMRDARAQRVLRHAVAAAGSEGRLRRAMEAQLEALSFSVTPREVVETAARPADAPRRLMPDGVQVAGAIASLGVLLVVLGSPPRQLPAAEAPSVSRQPVPSATNAPMGALEAGALPTLASCGIGPPDAQLAYAGWLTVDQLGTAPPDAAEGQPFYALIPAGDVAWNPPGLQRRIMPPVRGRLACLSTVTGAAPTVVGLPRGWEPPAAAPPFRPPTLADCGIRPADAPLAHRGWLLGEHLGVRPQSRPVFALVSEGRVSWDGPAHARHGRVACVVDADGGEPRAIRVPDGWSPPARVDGCPASPLMRFAGNLELGGPDAFVLLPPVSTSWWANDPSVRIMARLSPGPGAGSTLTATVRALGPGEAQPMRVVYTTTPDGRTPSDTHYVWLEGFVFTEPGCWVVSLAMDGGEVGWAVVPARARAG